ncbi:hypothetical protein ACFSM5_04620 [Lacibacterium aquatile]|uniref:Lipoprotein n=1 Tax=Lacibacterium aquatile TaxID=1168082 RepID=A0ABW5DN41_9PROT
MPSRQTATILCTIAVTSIMTGCAQPPSLNDPIQRQGLWFGVMEGADLKPTCDAGGTFWRAVYNGTYEKQVRVYTLKQTGATWEFSSFARDQMNFATVPVNLDDPLAPMRGRQTDQKLDKAAGDALDGLLRAAHTPLTHSQNLDGDGYWWLIHHCDKGAWTTAALRPQDGQRFSAFAPAPALQKQAGDAGALEMPPAVPERIRQDDRRFNFTITARPNGIASMPKLL